MPSFSMASASARMPRPDAFSERKSSSMMMMGNRNFMLCSFNRKMLPGSGFARIVADFGNVGGRLFARRIGAGEGVDQFGQHGAELLFVAAHQDGVLKGVAADLADFFQVLLHDLVLLVAR